MVPQVRREHGRLAWGVRMTLASQPDQVAFLLTRADDLRGRRERGAGREPRHEINRLELTQELGRPRREVEEVEPAAQTLDALVDPSLPQPVGRSGLLRAPDLLRCAQSLVVFPEPRDQLEDALAQYAERVAAIRRHPLAMMPCQGKTSN